MQPPNRRHQGRRNRRHRRRFSSSEAERNSADGLIDLPTPQIGDGRVSVAIGLAAHPVMAALRRAVKRSPGGGPGLQ
jgi:hypothetical protein